MDASDTTVISNQADEEILSYTVSDQELEAAADTERGCHLTLGITFTPDLLTCC